MELWRPVYLQKEYRLAQRQTYPTLLGVARNEAGFMCSLECIIACI